MARLVAQLSVEWRGLEEFRSSMQSIAEAMSNAWRDDMIEIESVPNGLASMGVLIASIDFVLSGLVLTGIVKPAAGTILFASAIMARLPSTATLSWQTGWPHIYCPPRDDRDVDDDPTPLVPNELVPA